MPSCAAQGCSARSDKGEVLKVFPRKNLLRRQIWIDRVNRPGWTPNRYSALCERHFDRDQWELPREDGKRKLKSTAVPSIFCVQHPPEDDLVAKEHAYCVLGYRKLFDHSDKEKESGILPIEHIKVEVDENENLADDVKAEEVEEEVDCDSSDSQTVENIQCTPDIFMFPASSELDPIETVDCQGGDINAFMSEPCHDPLAISSEDVELANQVVPHFSHSKKYLFITKDTKMVPKLPSLVEGEPAVSSEAPKLKWLSPKRLKITKSSTLPQGTKLLLTKLNRAPPNLREVSKPNDTKFSSPKESCPPKLNPMPNFLIPRASLPALLPKGPSPPKLIPMSKPVRIPFQKEHFPPKLTPISKSVHIPFSKRPSPPILTPISKPLRVIFPKVSPPNLTPISNSSLFSPPKLKLMSSSGLSSPVKLRIVSQSLSQKDVVNISQSGSSRSNDITSSATANKVLIDPRKRFKSTPKLVSAPKYLHSSHVSGVQHISEIPRLSPKSYRICLKKNKNLVSPSPTLHIDKFKGFNSVRGKNNGQRLVDSSMNVCVKLENILSEHQYTRKQPCDDSTLNGSQSELNSSSVPEKGLKSKLLGNNNVKVWLNHRNHAVNKTEPNSMSSSCVNAGSKTNIPLTSASVSRLAGTLTKASSVVVLNPFIKSDSSKSVNQVGKDLAESYNLDLFQCPICKLEFLNSTYFQTHMRSHKDYLTSDEEEKCVESSKRENTKVVKRPKYFNGTRPSGPVFMTNTDIKWKENLYKNSSHVQLNKNNIVLIPSKKLLKRSRDEEFIKLSSIVSTVGSSEGGMKDKVEGDSWSDPDKWSTSTESQDMTPKGLVIDKSGRRLSLRKKRISFKYETSPTTQIKKKPNTVSSSISLKKNPVVLLSKLNLNNIIKNKTNKDSVVAKSTELSDDDNSEGWKGWDISSGIAGCDSNSKNTSERLEADKQTPQTKSEKEDKNKSGANNTTKSKRQSQVHKKTFQESQSETSQNSSQNESSPMISNLKCPSCKLFIKKSKFKSHMLLHVKSEYSCKLCKKKFEKSFLLRRHVLQDHKVVKQFSCQRRDCSRRFESKRDLEKHMRSHRK